MILSIILPCYKVEQYIGRCLDSLLDQDLARDEYEIICVDDCSPDNLSAVVREYQKSNDNIKLITHEVNMTAGGARNTGIAAAKGKYVWFVDPDDTIVPDSFSKLLSLANSHILDILMFNYDVIDQEGSIFHRGVVHDINDAMPGEQFVAKNLGGRFSDVCMMVTCLYRRQFLLDNGLSFPKIRASQDVVFAWMSLMKAGRVASVSCHPYVEHKRDDSTTGNRGRREVKVAFSRTVLFPLQVLPILEASSELSVRKDLQKTIRWCVNSIPSSITVLMPSEVLGFRDLLVCNKKALIPLYPYMNKRTSLLVKSCGSRLAFKAILFTLRLGRKC